jgi:cell division protein FtsX
MTKLSTETRKAEPAREFAFVKQRKEPLEDATHVRNAIARFAQVQDVTDSERDAAWKKIKAAAKKHGVEIHEKSWRELARTAHKSH